MQQVFSFPRRGTSSVVSTWYAKLALDADIFYLLFLFDLLFRQVYVYSYNKHISYL